MGILFLQKNYYLIISKISKLNRDGLFLAGLFIKLFLIFLITSNISNDLFLPFIKNTIQEISLDPWSDFLFSGGDISSFPYGIIMVLAYLPLSFLGILMDKYLIDYDFFELGFKLSSLFFDYLLLIFLLFLTNKSSNKLLIICYWLSPILIYTTFIHGQLDIVPTSLLLGSILCLKFNNYSNSGFLFGLSLSSKFSMLIALPFILIFIYKRKGIGKNFSRFIITLSITTLALFIPYLYSPGFFQMVLSTKEISRFYTVFIFYGSNLKLYVAPIVYLFSLYLFWRINKITQDLLMVSIGIGFFSILVFLPPALGWTLWVIPFLAYYQIISGKDIFLISLIYSLLYIIIAINYEGIIIKDIFYDFYSLNEDLYSNIINLIFTMQQSLGLLLAVRIYIYGLKRNNFYEISNRSLLITINGNESININNLMESLKNLIYKKDINIISSSYIINEELNFKKNNNELPLINHNIKKEKSKIIYDANYLSGNIYKIEKELFKNNKPYQLLLNDLNIDLNLLVRKINIDIHINKNNKEPLYEFSLDEVKNKLLIFDFQPLRIKDSFQKNTYSMITYFPLGYLHKELFNLLISVCSLNVDLELISNKRIVKMEIEGLPSSEDVRIIAKLLIPEIEDLSLNEFGWKNGYIGIMQIILIAKITTILKNKLY